VSRDVDDPLHLLRSLPRPDAAWFVRPDGTTGAFGMHGVAHTGRVMVHAVELARAVGVAPWELQAVTLAALWHDAGRTHDGRDDLHGAKSAGKAVGLSLHRGVEARVLETALHAVTFHSTDDEDGEAGIRWLADPAAALRVLRILKDADALDRVRFSGLDTTYLRLAPSRARVDQAHALLRAVPEPSGDDLVDIVAHATCLVGLEDD
jgi:HD superfamily phosphodiesterase